MIRDLSRRHFLGMACTGLATALWSRSLALPLMHAASSNWGDPRSTRSRVFADLHAHPRLNDWIAASGLAQIIPGLAGAAKAAMNETSVDWKRCHQAGIDMICVAHFNPLDEFATMPNDPNPDAPRQTIRLLDDLESEIYDRQGRYARIVRSKDELMDCTSVRPPDGDYRIAVVHCIEGAHALGYDTSVIPQLAARGVAMVGVTHFFTKGLASSANSIPFFPDAGGSDPNVGLMPKGIEVVKALQANGILVDIAHATATTVQDILDNTVGPIIASHVSSAALGYHPYSLRDEHALKIRDRCGIIGVILMPYWLNNYASMDLAAHQGGLRDVVRTVRYLYKLCGTHKCIGIGSDFAGYITGPRDMKHLHDIARLAVLLREEFADEENPDQIVEDIMAGNVLRCFRENWGVKRFVSPGRKNTPNPPERDCNDSPK